MRAIVGAQLQVDGAQHVLDRLSTGLEMRGDVPVFIAEGQEFQHFQFFGSQNSRGIEAGLGTITARSTRRSFVHGHRQGIASEDTKWQKYTLFPALTLSP